MVDRSKDDVLSKLSGEAVFRHLAESGFEFLERAIGEVQSDPKFSVIHFATAIELLLKARLLKEHWTIIVRSSAEADREAFMRGEARTISTEEAIRRLEKIVGLTIPTDAAVEFRKLAAHRNRMVHFFHGAANKAGNAEERERVLREQHRCWFYLNALLTEWRSEFQDYASEIARVGRLMKKHTDYLAVVFEKVRPDLEKRKASGAIFVACKSCGHEAAAKDQLSRNVATLECAVCGISDSVVSFECEVDDCGIIEIYGSHPGQRTCPVCRTFYTDSELGDILDTASADPIDYCARNCALCMSPDTVVENDTIYVCTECLGVDDAIYTCGWCSEQQMGGGDLEHSWNRGCEFCDGKAGFERD